MFTGEPAFVEHCIQDECSYHYRRGRRGNRYQIRPIHSGALYVFAAKSAAYLRVLHSTALIK